MAGIIRSLAAFLLITSLADCSSISELFADKKPPTEIEIKPAAAGASLELMVLASPLINPDGNGAPSPMAVRIHLLNSAANFSKANFFQLWEKDEATLGPTLLGKQEFIIKPSEAQRLTMKLQEGTTMIGIVGGFRNFQNAKWRALFPLVGDQSSKLKLEIKTLSVDISVQE